MTRDEHIFVDLLGIPILFQKAAQDARASHPQNGLWHAGIFGSVALTRAGMSAFALSDEAAAHTIAGVDHGRLPDNETVLNQFADIKACENGT